jgi:hypothetical protein
MRVAFGIVLACLCPAMLHAGAVSQADFAFTMQFPEAIVNQFGYTSPKPWLPDAVTEEIGDGRVIYAKRATLRTINKDPLTVRGTAGFMQLETTNEGSATADIEGGLSGRMANLTNAPLTVTFQVNLGWSGYTHVDCDCNDFAEETIEAWFLIGNTVGFFDEKSFSDGPASSFDFGLGAIDVTIPAHTVLPYYVDWEMQGSVESFCEGNCGDTPEPGTLILFGSGSIGLGGLLGVKGLRWRRC